MFRNGLSPTPPRLALALLLAACAVLPAVCRAQDAQATPAHSPLVNLTVTVTDAKGNFVKGLGADSFIVYENRRERPVASLGETRGPLSVGLVFDMSGSMTYSAGGLDEARRAALEFVRRGDPANEHFVLGFNRETRLVADWTRDPFAVADGLNALPSIPSKKKGQTALYDALHEALSKLAASANPRRVLLVVTDGEDNSSRRKLSEVRRLAASTGALVYALGIYNHVWAGSGQSLAGWRHLEDICRATGGRPFYVQTFDTAWEAQRAGVRDPLAEVRRSFETIELELRNQYALGFYASPPAAREEWRRVEVRVRAPDKPGKTFRARAREGHLSPALAP